MSSASVPSWIRIGDSLYKREDIFRVFIRSLPQPSGCNQACICIEFTDSKRADELVQQYKTSWEADSHLKLILQSLK